jgi:hypothetical protein
MMPHPTIWKEGKSTPDRMPTSFLEKLNRTPETQIIWERLPRGLRCRLLVWIDCLYFPCEDSMRPSKVVWFVDQRTDRDWRADWPLPEREMELLILHLCAVV